MLTYLDIEKVVNDTKLKHGYNIKPIFLIESSCKDKFIDKFNINKVTEGIIPSTNESAFGIPVIFVDFEIKGLITYTDKFIDYYLYEYLTKVDAEYNLVFFYTKNGLTMFKK